QTHAAPCITRRCGSGIWAATRVFRVDVAGVFADSCVRQLADCQLVRSVPDNGPRVRGRHRKPTVGPEGDCGALVDESSAPRAVSIVAGDLRLVPAICRAGYSHLASIRMVRHGPARYRPPQGLRTDPSVSP